MVVHCLYELLDLLVEPSDIGVRSRRTLLNLHRLHSRVVFCTVE